MTVKLTTKLPKKDDRNGLGTIYRELLSDPYKTHLAVVVLDTAKITRDIEAEDHYPTVRIRAIEPITGGIDVGRLRTMLQRAYEQRTGNLELPADWEAVLAELPDGNGVIGGDR
jgi:hypothetical protein